jgi:2-keto-myo-inositol isomerase
MKICMSEITTMPADLPRDLQAYSNAGWRAVELHLGKVEKYLDDHSIEELHQELVKYGLRAAAAVGSAPSDVGLLLGDGRAFDRYVEMLARQLDLCRGLNIPILGIGSDPAGKAKGDWSVRAVRNLRIAGDVAEGYGVRLGVEFMSLPPPIGPFVLATLAETRDLVEAVAHPNVGINLDLFHFYRSSGRISDITSLLSGRLMHVHFCDVLHLPLEQLDDSHRVLPGEGILPLYEIARTLCACGYDGYLSLELLNQALWNDDPGKVAKRGWVAMQRFAEIV